MVRPSRSARPVSDASAPAADPSRPTRRGAASGRLGAFLATALVVAAPLALDAQSTARSDPAPVRYDDDNLPASFHRSRRAAVLEALPSDAVALVFSAPVRRRSNDVSYEYRQSSNLLYLTGSHEPGTVLVLAPAGVVVDGRRVRELLLVPPLDPLEEVWLGRRFGAERAQAVLGVEMAVEATRFTEIVEPLLTDTDRRLFHLPLPDDVPPESMLGRQIAAVLRQVEPISMDQAGLVGFVLDGMLAADGEERYQLTRAAAQRGFRPDMVDDPLLRRAAAAFLETSSFDAWRARRAEILGGRPDGTRLRVVLDRLRVEKTEEELRVLRRAIDITVAAHREVMRQVEPGWAEYEVEALLEYVFKREGAQYPAFQSIVGSGENSVILHYETNRRTMEGGDVVVIDVGAEVHGYAADVTRTLPVSGRFTEEQRAVYDVVLAAQRAAIDVALVGSSFGATHYEASRVLAEGLARLGLLNDAGDRQALNRFFMHGTSHYLGLDVHDVGDGGPLTAGTVITVEPGLYIPAAPDIDERWWNIGVRIEDDVLITDDGPVVLSGDAPRTAAEVERAMRGG